MSKKDFYSYFSEIQNLYEAEQILEWDQQVIMPKGGALQRAEVLSTLSKIVHDKITSSKTEDVIMNFEKEIESEWDKAHYREAKRLFEKQKKIPTELASEKTKVTSICQSVWQETKGKSDHKTYLPYLKKVLDVIREIAKCGNPENPYDFLLDDYEPYVTTQELDQLFENLKNELKILVKKYKTDEIDKETEVLKRFVPKENQEKIGLYLLKELGFDFERGRVDVSVHPFTSGTMDDVRLTTRYNENFLPTSLYGMLHEGGHAIYEQGLDKENFRLPAGQACSLGIHESQSRFYENIIGRSRSFFTKYFKTINEMANNAFNGVEISQFYKAINVVYPTFIRVEADEVTYNLHIVLRYEIEKELIDGSLSINDLPQYFNEKFEELFGIKVPSFSEGFMQDVHWSLGLIGYFPTYTLGNLYSAQIKSSIEREFMPISDFIKEEKLGDLKEILKEKIHRFGRLYPPKELIEKATGEKPSEKYYLEYIKKKYDEIE